MRPAIQVTQGEQSERLLYYTLGSAHPNNIPRSPRSLAVGSCRRVLFGEQTAAKLSRNTSPHASVSAVLNMAPTQSNMPGNSSGQSRSTIRTATSTSLFREYDPNTGNRTGSWDITKARIVWRSSDWVNAQLDVTSCSKWPAAKNTTASSVLRQTMVSKTHHICVLGYNLNLSRSQARHWGIAAGEFRNRSTSASARGDRLEHEMRQDTKIRIRTTFLPDLGVWRCVQLLNNWFHSAKPKNEDTLLFRGCFFHYLNRIVIR